MLFEIKFSNFLSYKNDSSLSLLASPLKEKTLDLEFLPFFYWKERQILKSLGIFGANGGGKSNALKVFRFLVESISGEKQNETPQNFRTNTANPFLLNPESEKKPTSLEIQFGIENMEYRYGVQFWNQSVFREWLYKKEERETKVFTRELQSFSVNGEYKILKEIIKNNMIREDALLLSVAEKFNDSLSRKIISYFNNYYFFDSSEIPSFFSKNNLILNLRNPRFTAKVVELLQKADTGIQNILLKQDIAENHLDTKFYQQFLASFSPKDQIISCRSIQDDKGNVLGTREFPFGIFESEGTRKFFYLAVTAIYILERGGVLFIDELDIKFHPILTKNLIRLFYNSEKNPLHAQVIFTAHDTSLLDTELLRRDQILLAEKDSLGSSSLLPLNSFKSEEGKIVRNDSSIGRNYLKGKYGGIPLIKDPL